MKDVTRGTYSYEGPIQLGSVVAHQCGAAQLFKAKEKALYTLVGREEMLPLTEDNYLQVSLQTEKRAYYILEVWKENCLLTILRGEVSTEGRKKIGKALLYLLRREEGLSIHGDWGSLVGVRPTKLVHKLLDMYNEEEKVRDILRNTYDVSDGKIDLAMDVCRIERPYVGRKESHNLAISIYGHIPFCDTHCTYCSFPFSLARNYKGMDVFMEAYARDGHHLQEIVRTYDIDVQDLYIGGGTPTSLREDAFETMLQVCAAFHKEGREFTVEAGRPDSVSVKKIESMKRYGVNRISINPQSMQDDVLKAIRRGHSVQDILDLYNYIRKHTNFSVNMDFICGLPLQSIASAQENLGFIEQLMPHNVTVHTLALKKGSPLYDEGAFHMPEEETVKEMVHIMHHRLLGLGYVPYYMYRQQYMKGQLENIGYTLPNFESTYNIHMMEERHTILGMGPSSVSKWIESVEFRQIKQYMPKDVQVYENTIEQLLHKRERISEEFWRG